MTIFRCQMCYDISHLTSVTVLVHLLMASSRDLQTFGSFYFESALALLDMVSLGLALPFQSAAYTFGSSDLAQLFLGSALFYLLAVSHQLIVCGLAQLGVFILVQQCNFDALGSLAVFTIPWVT